MFRAVCAACTIGEVGIPEPGDVPFQGGGVFLLPDPVPCSGQVQSWQGYGFFVPDDRVRNLTTRIFAAVFRPDDSEYKLVGVQRIEVPLPEFEVNGTFFNETAAGSDGSGIISVECGDRIVAGFDGECTNDPGTCPLIVVTTNHETTNATVDYTPFVLSTTFAMDMFTNRTDARIHMQATIVQQGAGHDLHV